MRTLTLAIGLLFGTVLGAADPRPPVTPDLTAFDADGNRLDDRLDDAVLALSTDPDARISVICCLTDAIRPADLALLEGLGGDLVFEYGHALHGFAVDLPTPAVVSLRDALGARCAAIIPVHETAATLDDTTLQLGVRQRAWPLGYAGNANTTVLIADSGFDDSHGDLATRVLPGCWADFSTSNLNSPRDFYSHGTLVASIAVGTGDVYGTVYAPTVTTVHDGWNPGTGAVSNFHFHKMLNPGLITLDFTFNGTGTFGLQDFTWNPVATGTGPSGSTLTHTPQLGGTYHSYLSVWNNNQWTPYRIRAVHPPSGTPVPFDGQNYLRGVAPEARLGGVKILNDDGSGNSAMMIAGMNWAIQNRDLYNIRIVNMSVALNNGAIDAAVNTAVQNLANNGILLVCTAANEFAVGGTIPSPGASPFALTVGAVNDAQQMANYSSNGAPGSSKPDVVAPGGSIVLGSMVTGADSNDGDAFGNFAQVQPDIHRNGYGTSMSAPHVAGLAAILIDVQETNGNPWQPTLARVMELKSVISMTAVETNTPGEMAWNFGSSPNTPSGNDPTLDRGARDLVEGYGQVSGGAAVNALKFTLSIPTVNALPIDFGFFPWKRRCWSAKLPPLTSGNAYTITGGGGGPISDCDIYLYEQSPTATGDPVIFQSSTNVGATETINFTADANTPPLYLVVKRVSASNDGYFYVAVQETGGSTHFRRGDVNADATHDISDVIALLAFLFSGGSASVCAESGDVNDDGMIDISDSINLLNYLFASGATPPAPFGTCGPDTDGDTIPCNAPTGGC